MNKDDKAFLVFMGIWFGASTIIACVAMLTGNLQ